MSLVVSSSTKAGMMAEIHKLSVEKTLNKIRADDAKQSKEAAFDDKIDVLDEEIGRMRAQRLRLRTSSRETSSSRMPRNVHCPATLYVWEVGIALILGFALISLWLYGEGLVSTHKARLYRGGHPSR